MMRAEGACLFFFPDGSRECDNFSAKHPGKLDGDVAKSANADNSHARSGVDAMVAQRAVDRNSPAQKRSCLLAGKRIGNLRNKPGVGANVSCITAVAVNAG